MKGQRQIQETAAMLLIGDGVLGLLRPSAHCAVWRNGNEQWDNALEWFARHPGLVRALAVIEVATGIAVARRQFAMLPRVQGPDEPPSSAPTW